MKKTFPFIILFSLFFLLWYELFNGMNQKYSTSLVGETIVNFQLPNILPTKATLSHQDLIGQVCLLNIWATWCYACKVEAPMLMEIQQKYHIPIYGIVYKDDIQQVKAWLKKYGDPYRLLGNDPYGSVSLDFGIYGTPETFIINREGKIVYRHIGSIDKKSWENTLYPLIKKL